MLGFCGTGDTLSSCGKSDVWCRTKGLVLLRVSCAVGEGVYGIGNGVCISGSRCPMQGWKCVGSGEGWALVRKFVHSYLGTTGCRRV